MNDREWKVANLTLAGVLGVAALVFWAHVATDYDPKKGWRVEQWGQLGDSMAPIAVVVSSLTLALTIWERSESKEATREQLEAAMSLVRAQEVANETRACERLLDEMASVAERLDGLASMFDLPRGTGERLFAETLRLPANEAILRQFVELLTDTHEARNELRTWLVTVHTESRVEREARHREIQARVVPLLREAQVTLRTLDIMRSAAR